MSAPVSPSFSPDLQLPPSHRTVPPAALFLHSQAQEQLAFGSRLDAERLACWCAQVVGYLLEELRGESNYAEFKKDVADANIFIASLIFIEELADKVRTATHAPIVSSAPHRSPSPV